MPAQRRCRIQRMLGRLLKSCLFPACLLDIAQEQASQHGFKQQPAAATATAKTVGRTACSTQGPELPLVGSSLKHAQATPCNLQTADPGVLWPAALEAPAKASQVAGAATEPGAIAPDEPSVEMRGPYSAPVPHWHTAQPWELALTEKIGRRGPGCGAPITRPLSVPDTCASPWREQRQQQQEQVQEQVQVKAQAHSLALTLCPGSDHGLPARVVLSMLQAQAAHMMQAGQGVSGPTKPLRPALQDPPERHLEGPTAGAASQLQVKSKGTTAPAAVVQAGETRRAHAKHAMRRHSAIEVAAVSLAMDEAASAADDLFSQFGGSYGSSNSHVRRSSRAYAGAALAGLAPGQAIGPRSHSGNSGPRGKPIQRTSSLPAHDSRFLQTLAGLPAQKFAAHALLARPGSNLPPAPPRPRSSISSNRPSMLSRPPSKTEGIAESPHEDDRG